VNKDDLYEILNNTRVIKSDEEIKLLEDIAKISSEAMKSSKNAIDSFILCKISFESLEICKTWSKRISTLCLVQIPS